MQQFAEIRLQPVHPGLEALEDGFFMVDPEWRVTYWNAAAERMLGIGRAAILGEKIWSALPFLDESNSREALRRAMRTATPRRYLDRFEIYPTGVLSIHAGPVEGGGLAVHFRDASEEVKQAERYSALLETIQDGFVAVDTDWRIVYVNAAAESLLRIRRQKAQNLSLWLLMPRAPEDVSECLRATMADGVKRHLSGVRPQGRIFRGRVYDLWTYPLAGGGLSILFEDVSERSAREEMLERLAREANEANEAKSRFFAAVSHELRTPLNAIVGYTHLLESGTYGPLPEGAQRAADRAGVCAEHLSRLVDDLLLLTASEVSRISMNPAVIDLPEALRTAAEPYRYQAESKGLTFSLEFDPVLEPIETDRERLRQIVSCLLANAVKFTSRGGIRVEVCAGTSDVAISVIDTGPGVRPVDCERIFAPFEQIGDDARSDPLARGVGLGLTISRQLATLLGGSLCLESTSPKGSRFTLRLPRACRATNGAEPPVAAAAPR